MSKRSADWHAVASRLVAFVAEEAIDFSAGMAGVANRSSKSQKWLPEIPGYRVVGMLGRDGMVAVYDSILQKLSAIGTDSPPPLESIRPDIPAPLMAIVNRMMDKDAEKRFAQPRDVSEAISSFCDDADLATLAIAELQPRGLTDIGSGDTTRIVARHDTVSISQIELSLKWGFRYGFY